MLVALPSLTADDTVIFVQGSCSDGNGSNAAAARIAASSKAAGASVARIIVTENVTASHATGAVAKEAGGGAYAPPPAWDAQVHVKLGATKLSCVRGVVADGEGDMLAEIAVKLVLNAVTTGA